MNHVITPRSRYLDKADTATVLLQFVTTVRENSNEIVGTGISKIWFALCLVFCSPIFWFIRYYLNRVFKVLRNQPITSQNYSRYRSFYEALDKQSANLQALRNIDHNSFIMRLFFWLYRPIVTILEEGYAELDQRLKVLDTPVEDDFFTPVPGADMWENRNKNYAYIL